ncbi:MAG: hypothetical protein JJE49_09625 [Peptostreptococcaceae bacterium]|nr:hypothetical protein [Peptostreptococcaceae bacterium]
MRRRYVICNCMASALKACPWAKVTVRYGSGYMCFESAYDHQAWENLQ